jgi:Protein of unknwon function (DUF3310)
MSKTEPAPAPAPEAVHHPAHYGGADDPYEAIKVIEAWGLGFALGSALKYIRRAGHKPGADYLEDLKKAQFYVDYEVQRIIRMERLKSTEGLYE